MHGICIYARKPLAFSEFWDRELSSRTSEVFGFSSILVGVHSLALEKLWRREILTRTKMYKAD
jgi:hypothetical protein